MFHEYSFQSPTRRNPAPLNHQAEAGTQYTHPQSNQNVSSTELNHLAHQFGQQSIRHDSLNPSSAYTGYTSTPYTNYTSAPYLGYSSTPYATGQPVSSPQHSYTCPHALTNVRAQRQVNTQLQYQPQHARELSSLVERTVAAGEQCLICSPSAVDYTSTETDEGLGDMEDYDYLPSASSSGSSSQTLSYRRSSDFDSQNYVTKAIRVRKSKRQKGDPSRLR
jgi:hypothetical protein